MDENSTKQDDQKNKKSMLDTVASMEEMKKDQEPEYVFLYWDEM